MKECKFYLELFAEGWSEKLEGPIDEHTDKPNKKLAAKIVGPGEGKLKTYWLFIFLIIIL